MICHDVFWLYGRLGRAAEREWTERNATDWRTRCRKFLATPLPRDFGFLTRIRSVQFSSSDVNTRIGKHAFRTLNWSWVEFSSSAMNVPWKCTSSTTADKSKLVHSAWTEPNSTLVINTSNSKNTIRIRAAVREHQLEFFLRNRRHQTPPPVRWCPSWV